LLCIGIFPMSAGGLIHTVLTLPRIVKRALALAIDVVLCAMSLELALFLRLGEFPPLKDGTITTLVLILVTALPSFAAFGLYRAIFRYAGWSAMVAILRAGIVASIPVIAIVTVIGVHDVPRTTGLIQPVLLMLLVSLVRAFARSWLGESYHGLFGNRKGRAVVIYGAGSAGRQLCSALANGSGMSVVGYVDDSPSVQGRTLNGVRIYAPELLAGVLRKHLVTDILLAIPSATQKRRNEVIASLRLLPVRVQTLPGFSDLAHGRVQLSDLHELDIDDLLGREQVAPDTVLLGRNVVGKTILVTGAGGSIGSELCRQILAVGADTLLLVDSSEYALYTLHQELVNRDKVVGDTPTKIVPLLASVRDERRMIEIVGIWQPDTIYHAAAYKHVPLVEHNVVEGIRNNVLGTRTMARVARDHKVSDFVLVSTDKAVRPTNVMGASKRLAEMTLQAMAREPGLTRFSMVRFGNVLGSSGSVVPLFRQQIRQGGPVTLTHADITRYFMTIPEAAQLVIQASAMASGGEVFVLDMGEPVRIIDLARNMIELSGHSVRDDDNPEGDIAIATVGLRPGEKLYEELLIGENPEPTPHVRIMKANERFIPWLQLDDEMVEMFEALELGDAAAVRGVLQGLVPEYQPQSASVDWVQLARNSSRPVSEAVL
jgi:FlaA1/EpsC-like NDP-sugar epimerase